MAGTFASRVGLGSSFGGTFDGPSRSLDFETGNSETLQLTSANFGAYDTQTFGVSFVFKPETLPSTQTIFCLGHSTRAAPPLQVQLDSSGKITVQVVHSDDTADAKTTTNTEFSIGTYAHVYIRYDSTESTESDRFRLYIDGSIPTLSTDDQPTLNEAISSSDLKATWGALENTVSALAQFTDGLIYQPAFYSGTIPNIEDIYNSSTGLVKDVRGITGLFSLLHTTAASTLEDDEVIATNWTNNNTVIKSTDIPT